MSTKPDASKRVAINTASVEEIATLDGVDEEMARSIVHEREASGPFEGPDRLGHLIPRGVLSRAENSIDWSPPPTTKPTTGELVGLTSVIAMLALTFAAVAILATRQVDALSALLEAPRRVGARRAYGLIVRCCSSSW